MDNLEYIDDYFNGILNEARRAQFEQLIRSDPAFAEEVAFYISAGKVLRQDQAEEKKTRFRALYEQGKNSIPSRSLHRRLPWYWAAAAVLIVALGAGLYITSRPAGPEKLADTYINDRLLSLPVRMSSTPDSLQNAISLYNDHRLQEALAGFERVLAKDPGKIPARIYAGIVYLRLKDYDKSLQYFKILQADTALYANPALFYQSLALMKRNRSGDAQVARQLLQQVVNNDLDKKEDAAQLLKNW